MSLIPMLFSDWWENLDRPHRVCDQYFGMPPDPDSFYMDICEPARSMETFFCKPRRGRRRYHPFLRNLEARKQSRSTTSTQDDKEKFLVTLDVHQFGPEEITVKLVDRNVVVEAKHDEKEDAHGWISREFVRKYPLPAQCDVDQLTSTLSSDGILTIMAPTREPRNASNERTVKVQYTGQPAIANYESSWVQSPLGNKQSDQSHQRQQQQQQQQQGHRGRKGTVKAA